MSGKRPLVSRVSRSFVSPSNGHGLFTAPLTVGENANGAFRAMFATGAQAAFQ